MTMDPGQEAGTHAGQSAVGPRRVVLVTGLSGAGKASMLRVLEDLGFEAVDNPPQRLMEELAARGDRPIAIGVDARSRGFEVAEILAIVDRLRRNAALHIQLVFVFADEGVLLRRYTETRRRHPLAPVSRVSDGVSAEIAMTAPLREAADMLLDTTDLPLPMLRRIVEQRFGDASGDPMGMTVSMMSFAYPAGLPREAELVFDARFLRNPHYVPILRDRTGLDSDVAAYVKADPDFEPFVDKITDLLTMLLPRFVQEGKKYASVAVGCTGGRHRSVHVIEQVAARLLAAGDGVGGPAPWRVAVAHRELSAADRATGGDEDLRVRGLDGHQTSEQRVAERHGAGPLIDPARTLRDLPAPGEALLPAHQDTTYLCVVDRDGNACSFINSLFQGFGSGILAERSGVMLQNRGFGFRIERGHPNCIAPGRRPMHTIIPAMLTRDGRPVMPFGVMGGHFQPMGQTLFLSNLLEYGLDIQQSLDLPRLFGYAGEVKAERGIPAETVAGLRRLGHVMAETVLPHGGGQAIWIDHDRGTLIGGSDPRKDGVALGL